jgi:hypothetical protein
VVLTAGDDQDPRAFLSLQALRQPLSRQFPELARVISDVRAVFGIVGFLVKWFKIREHDRQSRFPTKHRQVVAEAVYLAGHNDPTDVVMPPVEESVQVMGLRARIIVTVGHLEHQVDAVPVERAVQTLHKCCHIVLLTECRGNKKGSSQAFPDAASRSDSRPRDRCDTDERQGDPHENGVPGGVGLNRFQDYAYDETAHDGGRQREPYRHQISIKPRHGKASSCKVIEAEALLRNINSFPRQGHRLARRLNRFSLVGRVFQMPL